MDVSTSIRTTGSLLSGAAYNLSSWGESTHIPSAGSRFLATEGSTQIN